MYMARNGYTIMPMRLADVDEIMEIERVAFPTPWAAHAYRYELRHNELAHYFVARARATETKVTGIARYLPRRIGQLLRKRGAVSTAPIWGYVGAWLLGDESHISTIAVHPKHRMKGIAQALIAHIIGHAVQFECILVTLEVRESNYPAQNLYTKFGFEVVGRRKNYYSDNGEDALIMTLNLDEVCQGRSASGYTSE